MKFNKYVKDKFFEILIVIFFYFLLVLLLAVFRVSDTLMIAVTFVFFLMIFVLFLMDFIKKKSFYDEFVSNVEHLDKKYLILETLSKPNFYEGEILYQNLYEIDKSMAEIIKNKNKEIEDFKEYVEMWIHEAKIPISSLTLLCHNHKEKVSKTYLNQIRKLDNYIDQVLYYVRSNYAEEDFMIKKVQLDKVVSGVLLKNKDDLLENRIDLDVRLKGIFVYSDQKWLDFILNQIINNSIKYKRDGVNSKIKISAVKKDDKVILSVSDNGVGIPSEDLNKIFRKSFTGSNGRNMAKSTGMGLYIADKLCRKLGHILEADSVFMEYTEIRIVFGNNNYYKVNE